MWYALGFPEIEVEGARVQGQPEHHKEIHIKVLQNPSRTMGAYLLHSLPPSPYLLGISLIWHFFLLKKLRLL